MRKLFIIGIALIIIVIVVVVYSCSMQGGSGNKTDAQVGGLYTGTVVAVAQNQGETVIYWSNGKSTKVAGMWMLDVGASYVIQTKEVGNHLEITGIQIKK